MRKCLLLLQELQQGLSSGLSTQHRLRAATRACAWQGVPRAGVVWVSWQGGSPHRGDTPHTLFLSAGRSLDRLDSVEILLPPKFPTWEEEYNQISDSVNESSCINQVRCWSAEPAAPAHPSEKGGQLRGERNIFPLQNKALAVLQELHVLAA